MQKMQISQNSVHNISSNYASFTREYRKKKIATRLSDMLLKKKKNCYMPLWYVIFSCAKYGCEEKIYRRKIVLVSYRAKVNII